MVAVYVVLGAALWLTGAATRGGRFSGMHELWGILLVCGGLYVLGLFRHGWGWRHEEGAPWLAVWPLLSWAVIAGGVAWRRRREELGWVAAGGAGRGAGQAGRGVGVGVGGGGASLVGVGWLVVGRVGVGDVVGAECGDGPHGVAGGAGRVGDSGGGTDRAEPRDAFLRSVW